jgi:predicted nucleic acid-binding protein
MPASVNFFDSNIILYALSEDEDKAAKAIDLMAQGGAISIQVLNEVTNVARGKYKYDWRMIDRLWDGLLPNMQTYALEIQHHVRARELAERYNFHIFDATILASALLAGCSLIYSEDMQHGQAIDGRLTICNPFI